MAASPLSPATGSSSDCGRPTALRPAPRHSPRTTSPACRGASPAPKSTVRPSTTSPPIPARRGRSTSPTERPAGRTRSSCTMGTSARRRFRNSARGGCSSAQTTAFTASSPTRPTAPPWGRRGSGLPRTRTSPTRTGWSRRGCGRLLHVYRPRSSFGNHCWHRPRALEERRHACRDADAPRGDRQEPVRGQRRHALLRRGRRRPRHGALEERRHAGRNCPGC